MKLTLVGTDGIARDRRKTLRVGFKIGRKDCDFNLKDTKVSILHAEIIEDSEGNLILQDRNSTNGIRFQGVKVDSVTMLPGVVFQIGGSTFTVEEVGRKELSKVENLGWSTELAGFLSSSGLRKVEPNPQIVAFPYLLEMEFITGPQCGSKWVLGYGPRSVGRVSPDLAIDEPNAPDQCFQLIPTVNGVEFLTDFPNEVRLNNESIRTEMLRDGDMIKVHDSTLKVKFGAQTPSDE